MSIQITKLKGIPIRLHFTLIIVFFLVAWTLSGSLMPEIYPGLTRGEYWIIGTFGASTSFISILLHELAHSIVALRYGLRVRQIILFIFGGVSDIEEGDSSKDFHKEFKIAVAGTITSFAIAALLGLSWWVLTSVAHEEGGSSHTTIVSTYNATKVIAEAVLLYGAIINIVLGIFNLVPAFPLDGGRILRSALLRWKRDYDKSTKLTVRIGIAISYVFMAVGFITMLSGSFISGMWLALIGWFLNSGAHSYLEQHQLSTALSGVYLRDIMNTSFVSINSDITVNELLNTYLSIYRKSEFPVVRENAGIDELVGAATSEQALKVPEHVRDKIRVQEIMVPRDKLIIMTSNMTADEALRRMFRENKSRIFICDNYKEYRTIGVAAEGRRDQQGRQKLVGLISKTDILNIAKEREEFNKAIKKLTTSTTDVITFSGNSNIEKITSFSTNSSSSYNSKFNILSRWRFLFLVFGMIVFIAAYSVGAMFVKINPTQSEFIKIHFQEQIRGINQNGIFANNFRAALVMFIPGLGVALGMFTAFSTGLVFNALSHTPPVVSDISPLIVFLTPFGILEIIAYGFAISRSGMLSYQLIKDANKKQIWQKYVTPTLIEIGIVLALLIVGAMVEWQMIRNIGI